MTSNCSVIKTEVVNYPPIGDDPDNQEDTFYRVQCAVCGTDVAVMEKKEEIYHFFNVMPGH